MEKSLDNPIVYIFLVIIHASLITGIFKYSIIGAAIFVASFLLCLIIVENKKVIIINIILFVIAVINAYAYYNMDFINGSYLKVRISDKYKNTIIAEAGNRRIKLNGISKLEENKIYYIKGTYEKELDLESRTVGILNVDFIREGKEDIIYKINRYRNNLADKVFENMDKDEAEIVLSASLGIKDKVSYKNKELLNSLGISHVICLSGLHVMIIGAFLRRIFGEKISLIILGLYILFTGLITSAVRAFIMVFIMRFGAIVKRKYNSLGAMCLAGTFMLLYKPYYIFDFGCVLSYLATLGIIISNKKLNRKLYKLPNKIRETVSISLSANSLTFPYICLSINKFSLVFLLGNILIVPLFTPVLILGNLLIVLQYIKPLFDFVCIILNNISGFIIYISDFLSNISPNIVEVNGVIAGCYWICFIAYYLSQNGIKECRKLYYMAPVYTIISLIGYI